jgi:hypothetical protein
MRRIDLRELREARLQFIDQAALPAEYFALLLLQDGTCNHGYTFAPSALQKAYLLPITSNTSILHLSETQRLRTGSYEADGVRVSLSKNDALTLISLTHLAPLLTQKRGQ